MRKIEKESHPYGAPLPKNHLATRISPRWGDVAMTRPKKITD